MREFHGYDFMHRQDVILLLYCNGQLFGIAHGASGKRMCLEKHEHSCITTAMSTGGVSRSSSSGKVADGHLPRVHRCDVPSSVVVISQSLLLVAARSKCDTLYLVS